MATPASVDQVVQVGIASADGTRVPATRRLPGVSIDVRPSVVRQSFRAKGSNVNTADVIHRMSAEGDWEGPLDYNQILYPFETLLGEVNNTPAQIGSTGCWVWEYIPVSFGADLHPKTLSVEMGWSEAAQIADYVRMISAELDFGADALNMRGALLGMFPEDDQTLTASQTSNEIQKIIVTADAGTYTITFSGQTTADIDFDATASELEEILTDLSNIPVGGVNVTGGPGDDTGSAPYFIEFTGTLGGANQAEVTTDVTNLGLGAGAGTAVVSTTQAGGVASALTTVAQRPVSRMQVDVYVDDTAGALGTTKVTSAYNAGFSIGAKWAAFFAMNTDFPSFQDLVHIAADISGRFSTAHNAQSRALYNEIASNPTKFVRIEAIGENIGTSADEMIRVDFAAKFGTPEKQELDGAVFGYNYNWGVIHDSDLGSAWKLRVQNRLSAL